MITTETMLVLSTAHLLETTCNQFLPIAQNLHPVFEKGAFGWFVYVFDDDPSYLPDELQACLNLARTMNCQWIMFDRDAPPIDDLPTLSGETHEY